MRIYVGNLPYAATEDEIRQLFEAHGPVASASIIKDKFSGQSKGFGFVEMEASGDAQGAIDALNGTEIHGRRLNINEARPMPEGSRGGGGGRRGGGGQREGGGQRRW